jgi:hypothetical protein
MFPQLEIFGGVAIKKWKLQNGPILQENFWKSHQEHRNVIGNLLVQSRQNHAAGTALKYIVIYIDMSVNCSWDANRRQ